MPMNKRAAKRLLKFSVKPAHMLDRVSSRRLPRMTGRRPNVLARGTHHKFEKPSMRMLTATK